MDDDVLALNKPPGLAVQGDTKTAQHLDAMLDALKFKAIERPRLVHHLDKDTSSLLLLARALPPQGHSPLRFGTGQGRGRQPQDGKTGKRTRFLRSVVVSAGPNPLIE